MNRYLSFVFIVIFAGLSSYFYSGLQSQKRLSESLQKEVKKNVVSKAANELKLETLIRFIEGNWSEALEIAKEYDEITSDTDASLYLFLSSKIELSEENDSLGSSELAKLQYRLKITNDSLRSNQNIINKLDSELTSALSDLESFLENKSGLLVSLTDCREQLKTAQNIDTLMFKVSTGYLIRYYGQTKSGMANGRGSGFWPSGGYYHGEWRDNARH